MTSTALKKRLLGWTALCAVASLGVAVISATPAKAFDENNWTWDKTVTETVEITVDILSEINPTGHFELQDFQEFNGDVVATVDIQGDYLSNDAQFGGLDGTQTVPVTLPFSATANLNGTYNANLEEDNIETANLDFTGEENTNLEVENSEILPGSVVSVSPSEFNFNLGVDGTVEGEAEVDLSEIEFDPGTVDATTDLANVSGAATAVANFKSIESETATFLDEVQVHNSGQIGVSATSTAGNIEDPIEAAVVLDSTAISNLLTVDVAAADPNNVFIGDVSQTTDANVFASASTTQDLTGFNNLGSYAALTDADGNALAGRVADLTATAIGNFAAIAAGPSVELGDIGE